MPLNHMLKEKFVFGISFFIVHILHCILNCVTQYYNPSNAQNELLLVNRKDLLISDYLWKIDHRIVLPEQSHLNVRDKATTHTDNGDGSVRWTS